MMKKRRPIPPVPIPRTSSQKRPSKPKPEVQKGEISSIGQIFADTFGLYKRRALPLIGVTFLGYLFIILIVVGIGFGIFYAFGQDMSQVQQFINNDLQKIFADPSLLLTHPLALPLLGGGLACIFIYTLLTFWLSTASMATIIDEHHGVIEALCTGWKYVFPMMWISCLALGIITTASIFFIIPAFVLMVSMSLSLYIMIDEDRTGLDALMASRLYVRGHWWNTFFKMLLMGLAVMVFAGVVFLLTMLLSLLMGLISSMLHSQAIMTIVTIAISLIGQILFYLVAWFPVFYMVAVYRDLKQAAGRVDPDSTYRCIWMPMALFGIMLPLLGIIGAFIVAGPKLPGELENIQAQVVQQIQQVAAQQGVNLPLPATSPNSSEPASDTAVPPQVQIAPSVDGFIVWRDPAGDTRNPLLDIKEMSASGQGGVLQLAVTLAKPLSEYFAAADRESFDALLSVYFDTDMNPATGDVLPDATDRGGYDLELDILLASPNGTGQAFSSLYALSPQQRQSLEALPEGNFSITDNKVEIRLPYERLNTAAGSNIRACFREANRQEGSGLADDQTIPLQ
jgi:hypothetical protein